MSKRKALSCAGQHAIVEANGPIAHLPSSDLLALMERSALAAGATIVAKHCHLFGEGQGVTGVVLLAESHISVHTWPEHDYAAFDIFMCGEVKLNRALEVLREACCNEVCDIGVNPEPAKQKATETFFAKVIQRGRHPSAGDPEKIAAQLQSDTPTLAAQIADRVKFSPSQAGLLLTELVKFLLLCSRTQQALMPSRLVDCAWQQMVLHTEVYERLLPAVFKPLYSLPTGTLGSGQPLRLPTYPSLLPKRFRHAAAARLAEGGVCGQRRGLCAAVVFIYLGLQSWV